MTPIAKKRIQIEKRLATAQKDMSDLRAFCPHTPSSVRRTPKSDTGNWCAADDRYWTACECLDCGKHWTEWK